MPADASDWDQDTFFTVLTAARLVPRAALHSSKLAKQICSVLPEDAASFDELVSSLNVPPDLQNVVMMTAVAGADGCQPGYNVTQLLFQQAQTWATDAQAAADAQAGKQSGQQSLLPLMQHQRRSAAFALAMSPQTEVLRWLAHDVGVQGAHGGMGLRAVDRVTLLTTIAQGPETGFSAVQAELQAAGSQLFDAAQKESDGNNEGSQSVSMLQAHVADAQAVVQQAANLASQPLRSRRHVKWLRSEGALTALQVKQVQEHLQMERQAARAVCKAS